MGSSIPLIANLRMNWTFKDEAKEEGVSVINLVLLALQLLRENTWEVVGFIKLMKL